MMACQGEPLPLDWPAGAIGECPFTSEVLGERYSTAIEVQRLVVHLFNATVAPDMGSLMRADKQHRTLVLKMLAHYARHGEECSAFMAAGRRLVEVQP